MGRVRRARMSSGEEAEVWTRWQRGESCVVIGRALDRDRGAIFTVVARRGGIPPPPRRRSRLALCETEREEISRGLARGESLRQIGRRVGRAASTVSREVRRHGGRRHYRAATADTQAWDRARRPKSCRLAGSVALRRLVAIKLARDWSPQQIAGWLTRTFPDDPCLHVSHETIYRSLYVQSGQCSARGAGRLAVATAPNRELEPEDPPASIQHRVILPYVVFSCRRPLPTRVPYPHHCRVVRRCSPATSPR